MPTQPNTDIKYNIKVYVMMAVLFTEAFLLAYILMGYIRLERYFNLDYTYPLQIIGLMVVLGWTLAISIGAWCDRSRYFIIAFPIAAGIATVLWSPSFPYALAVFGISLVVVSTGLKTSIRFMNLFIKFEPSYILRHLINSTFLVFSIYGALTSYHFYQQKTYINIGRSMSNAIGDRVDTMVKEQVQKEVDTKLRQEGISLVSPQMMSALENMGIYISNKESSHVLLDELEFNTKAIIETQVNRIIRPYQHYLNPFVSFVVFSILQFYGAAAYFIIRLTVKLIYSFGFFISIIRIEKIPAEREVLRF